MNKNNIENNINANCPCPPSPTASNHYEMYDNPEEYINIIENIFEYDNKNKKLIIKTMDKTKANTNEDKDFNKKINNVVGLSIEEIGKKVLEISQKEIEELNKDLLIEKKKCGRKRKREGENKNEHNKFSDDNMRRKCKHIVIKNALQFINQKIFEIYNGKIGNGIYRKELQTLNQSQKSDATVNFNKIFITKKLGEILSENISGRFTNLPLNHNKRLIDNLLNENDENKRNYFNRLFNITFLDCLKHFRGDIVIDELIGLNTFDNEKKVILDKYIEDGADYVESLQYYLKNFEEIVNNKRSRKPRKK